MNRPFPRLEVLGLTAALALAGACTPNNSVKPGAPVLIELSIVENGGASITTVKPETGRCPTPMVEGGPCDSVNYAVCESVTTNNLCRCIPNPAPTPPPPPPADAGTSDAATSDAAAATSDAGPPDGGATSDSGTRTDGSSDAGSDAAPASLDGTWSCTFAPTSSILYIFDRVLDTEFLGDGGGAPGLATLSSTPAAPTPVTLNGDYASNGSPNEVIFPLLGAFRSDGPSLLFTGVPALPAGSTVTVSLNKTKVLAKDGRTPFTGTNLLVDGTISFATGSFGASIDAPSMAPATVTFSNLVDPAALVGHITVTATPVGGGAPVVITPELTSMDGMNVSVAPMGATDWPPNSTIDIKVDATTPDVVGDTLGADVTASLTTSAM
jgi:hypothetical protein